MSLRVPALTLPSLLPTLADMESFRDNHHGYEPNFWELFYEGRRYLERATDAQLMSRYQSIIRNMKALVRPSRHKIPIQDPLSSWYWFKKEHETRLELFLRGLNVASQSEVFNVCDINIDSHTHLVRGEALFRYHSQSVIRDMMMGRIQIRPASFYKDTDLGEARSDDEQSKSCFVPGRGIRIVDKYGNQAPIIGNLKRTASLPDYYVLCFSWEWDPALMAEFGGACARVSDADQFAERLNQAFSHEMQGWEFHHFPVQYFDPLDGSLKQLIDPGISKDFRYAYQREYRFVWFHPDGHETSGIRHANMGYLGGIAQEMQ